MVDRQKTDRNRPITRLKDIAQKANVSIGTVDRALHNRGRVSEEVRKRILKIAKELDYQPNLHARALVSNKRYRIAALVPDPSLDEYWSEPMKGIEIAARELKQYGVSISKLVFNSYDVNTFRESASKITNQEFDGVLTAPIFHQESLPYIDRWKEDNLPFSFFNTQIPDSAPLSYIGQDSYQSGYLAGKLIHYGNKNAKCFLILHVDEDVQNSSHLIKKAQGFSEYFAANVSERQIKIEQVELHEHQKKEGFFRKIDDLIEKYPEVSGIFVTNSRAYSIAEYLETKQIDNIDLIGYDLVERNLRYLQSGIIQFLINQNPRGQGYYGIYSLINHLLFKQDVSKRKYLPLDIVTKENLTYYIESNIK